MHNVYVDTEKVKGNRVIWSTPRAYMLSLQRSIEHYRKARASQDYLNYLYALYYDALDDVWEAQEGKKP